MTNPSQPSPNRRELLTAGATAASVLAVAGAASARQDDFFPVPKAPQKKAKGQDETLNIGIIGCGGMGGGHLNGMIGSSKGGRGNCNVVAIAEVCKSRLDGAMQKATEKQPGVEVKGYRDYRELLARDDIDCVLIASPEHWHAHHAVAAIEAGKDVYLEKPMTLRLNEAMWVYRVMEANPHMILQVGTQYMMMDKYVEARRLIQSGAIGHPTFSQTSYCRNSLNGEWLYGINPIVEPGEQLDWEAWCGPLGVQPWDTEVYHRWRRYRTFSTGIIGDLLVHMMTPMVNALDVGWPVRVTATGGHYVDDAMENHDQINLTVQFEKEHTMVVAGSTCNEQGLETMIRGHRGNIYLGGSNCKMTPERIFVDEIDQQEIACQNKDWQNELRLNWMNSVRTREPNQSPVSVATQIMVIVDLATRSIWEGSAYTFDPSTMTASRA